MFFVHYQFTNVVKDFLRRIEPDVYLDLTDSDTLEESRSDLFRECDDKHNNFIPTLAVIETMSTFYVIQQYIPYCLQDIVSYSPAAFDNSHAKSLFVFYQILRCMESYHQLGASLGKLTLDNVRLDDKFWVYCMNSNVLKSRTPVTDFEDTSKAVSDTDTDTFYSPETSMESHRHRTISEGNSGAIGHSLHLSEADSLMNDAIKTMQEFHNLKLNLGNLGAITEDWVHYRISNFRYLLYLNFLIGRRLEDPNHHPVLPWVMDFSSPTSGFRDLTMSKFRLNKGDSQLDFTFETMAEMGGQDGHVPHHVSDILSDITYYVYKARQTPKHLLCSYVRTKWVPNEYPASIERMYHWTPDECIPEFFTDPSIFTSIHEDLPDLDLPSWCSSAAEFVERHLNVLESDQVSCYLHHWIDTTFGCKVRSLQGA